MTTSEGAGSTDPHEWPVLKGDFMGSSPEPVEDTEPTEDAEPDNPEGQPEGEGEAGSAGPVGGMLSPVLGKITRPLAF